MVLIGGGVTDLCLASVVVVEVEGVGLACLELHPSLVPRYDKLQSLGYRNQ